MEQSLRFHPQFRGKLVNSHLISNKPKCRKLLTVSSSITFSSSSISNLAKMSENSENFEILEMKMEAMKKVYADVILNTSKEAAARVMLSERKALQFHKELICLKEDYARMMLRLNNNFKFQIQEAEARSLNQQKKIDELEAQLGEAEGIIVDLRDEIKQLREKLETMTNTENRLSSGHISGRLGSSITSQVSDAKAALVEDASLRPIALNCKSFHVMDSYRFPGKSNLDGDEDLCSYKLQNTTADLCRNGYFQRKHSFERNSSTMKLPTLKASYPKSLVSVLVETSEAKSRKISLVQSVEKPFPIYPSKTNEKFLNSISYNKDQTIRTPRRSAGKNARYREAIASLRGKPRKKYVKSWKLPFLGQLKACSSHLNVHSVENPAEAAQTLPEKNICCATVSEDSNPRSDVMNRCKDVLTDGELDSMVCGERGDGEEAMECLRKKICHTSVDGLVESELFDVPISEGFGSFHKQVENLRPLGYTFHRKRRKNVSCKLDENIVPEKNPGKRKLQKLTDVSVVESNGLNNGIHGALEMAD